MRVTLVVVALALSVAAQADEIEGGIRIFFDPQDQQYSVLARADGPFLVTTSIASGAHQWQDGDTDMLSGWFQARGYFTEPGVDDPYFDFLIDTGLHTFSSASVYEGQNSVAYLAVIGEARLFRAEDSDQLDGRAWVWMTGSNIQPINPSWEITIFDSPLEDGTEWEAHFNSDFVVVPQPASALLFGLAAPFFRRRS